MKKRKWLLILSGCLVASIFLIFVLIERENASERRWKLIYIPKVNDTSNDFWTSLLEGAQMGADEFHGDITFMASDSEEDYETQNRLILAAIEEKPDAILLSPCSYTEVTDTAKKVKAAGIRLILVDSLMDEKIEDASIATDNFRAGVKMGQYMTKQMNAATKIGIVSHVQGSSTAIEREKGLRHGLGDYEERIQEVVFCNSDYDKAYEETKKMLREHPGINVIFGLNEYSAVGAARAVRDLGLTKQIQMVGFDSSIEEIQMLEEGVFSGIVIQKPFSMGYLGVEKAVSILKGASVKAEVDSGSELITKENMYTDENQKLLFPFWDK